MYVWPFVLPMFQLTPSFYHLFPSATVWAALEIWSISPWPAPADADSHYFLSSSWHSTVSCTQPPARSLLSPSCIVPPPTESSVYAVSVFSRARRYSCNDDVIRRPGTTGACWQLGAPDGEDLQYPEILLRYLHLVQVYVAPGQGRPHEVAVAGTDGGDGLAVVPGGPRACSVSPAVGGREGEININSTVLFDRD